MNLKNTISQGDLQYLPATDLRWLARHYCVHHKPFLIHPACFTGEKSEQKILLFDLETTAHKGYFWDRIYETNIIEVTECGRILSYAAQWNEEKSFVRGWIDFKKDFEKNLVKELFDLFCKADYVVAHNGKAFDIKWCNTKFTEYGLGSPSPYKVIDTLTEYRKYFKLPSYKLDFICQHFGIGKKKEHEGWALWKKCMAIRDGVRDVPAWNRMKNYNKHDVFLLKGAYEIIKPFRK